MNMEILAYCVIFTCMFAVFGTMSAALWTLIKIHKSMFPQSNA